MTRCWGAAARWQDWRPRELDLCRILADGVSSRADMRLSPRRWMPELAARRAGAQRACEILGVTSVFFGDLPDNRLDTIALLDIVKMHRSPDCRVSARYRVYASRRRRERRSPAHSRGGGHRLPAASVATRSEPSSPSKCLPAPSGSCPGRVSLLRLTGSSTSRRSCARKLAALDAYAGELRDWPHPRSRQGVEHLARWRGATVGVDAAEAFILGRQIS